MTRLSLLLVISSVLCTTLAAPAPGGHHDHEHVTYSRRSDEIIKKWHQDDDSESAKLFRRAVPGDGTIGSQAWLAAYPTPGVTPVTSSLPQPWLDRLNQVRASSTWPKYGPSALNGGYPLYTNPNGGGALAGTDPSVCSGTYQCSSEADIYNLTDGTIGLNFDDGPAPAGGRLYDFIDSNNISATHFMIGSNIYYNSAMFLRAIQTGGHLAVHTWSHPYMTTLTDEQVLGELGWTAQIIADNNGGRVPAYWRPPFGDVDNRVRMIALEVFGMKTVPWQIDRDSGDYNIGHNPAYTFDSVTANMGQWLNGSKTNGLLMLEHEISDADVDVFMAMYPRMISAGWKVLNVAEAADEWEYVNSEDDDASVGPATQILQTAAPGDITTYEFAAVGTGVMNTSVISATMTANATSMATAAANSTSVASATSTSAFITAASNAVSTSASVTRSASVAAQSTGAADRKVKAGIWVTILGVGLGALAF